MNNFHINPKPRSVVDGSYVAGYGRHRDIRYKIAKVRGTYVAVYIGLTAEHPLSGASLAKLNEALPDIKWSYASPDLLYSNKSSEPLWWIGWIYEGNQPSIAEANEAAKATIKELAKGALRGEISPNH